MGLCEPSTRIVIAYYSHLWEPVLKLAELLRLKSRQSQINYIATVDFLNLMDLADFEVIRGGATAIDPHPRWFGLGPFINRFIAPLPAIRQLCLRTYLVGRPVRSFPDRKLSASILIPCRNERGNIEDAIRRMPRFGSAQEILFVEGNSSDGTFEECERVRDAYRDSWDIKVLKQDGKGKGDAVRKGFAAASNDVLMIFDADLTDAAGSAAQVSCRHRNREGRVRQRHPAGLSDGKRSDASAQLHCQSLLCLSVQLSRQYPADRHAVRHQSAAAAGITRCWHGSAAISATSIHSAIST